jgi:hypothetical protein
MMRNFIWWTKGTATRVKVKWDTIISSEAWEYWTHEYKALVARLLGVGSSHLAENLGKP